MQNSPENKFEAEMAHFKNLVEYEIVNFADAQRLSGDYKSVAMVAQQVIDYTKRYIRAESKMNGSKGGKIGGKISPTNFKNNKGLASTAGKKSKRRAILGFDEEHPSVPRGQGGHA